jgi:hypothetical protein
MASGDRILSLFLVLAVVSGASATPPGSVEARQAMELCERAETETAAARVETLTRGLALAEGAVSANERDGLGQFALFCNLARRVRQGGLGLGSAFEVMRALRALDRAVALAPMDADVMTAKGALLIELPAFLGGDAEEGETWIRRALAIAPDHATARTYLRDDGDVRRASR